MQDVIATLLGLVDLVVGAGLSRALFVAPWPANQAAPRFFFGAIVFALLGSAITLLAMVAA